MEYNPKGKPLHHRRDRSKHIYKDPSFDKSKFSSRYQRLSSLQKAGLAVTVFFLLMIMAPSRSPQTTRSLGERRPPKQKEILSKMDEPDNGRLNKSEWSVWEKDNQHRDVDLSQDRPFDMTQQNGDFFDEINSEDSEGALAALPGGESESVDEDPDKSAPTTPSREQAEPNRLTESIQDEGLGGEVISRRQRPNDEDGETTTDEPTSAPSQKSEVTAPTGTDPNSVNKAVPTTDSEESKVEADDREDEFSTGGTVQKTEQKENLDMISTGDTIVTTMAQTPDEPGDREETNLELDVDNAVEVKQVGETNQTEQVEVTNAEERTNVTGLAGDNEEALTADEVAENRQELTLGNGTFNSTPSRVLEEGAETKLNVSSPPYPIEYRMSEKQQVEQNTTEMGNTTLISNTHLQVNTSAQMTPNFTEPSGLPSLIPPNDTVPPIEAIANTGVDPHLNFSLPMFPENKPATVTYGRKPFTHEQISNLVEQLARPWTAYGHRDYSWCRRTKVKNEGMLFVKTPKCASSTAVGVVLRIADKMGRRLMGNNKKCFARVKHGVASSSQRQYGLRNHSTSTLWSMVRNPSDRMLSLYFFEEVSRKKKNATEQTILEQFKKNPGMKKTMVMRYLKLVQNSNDELVTIKDIMSNYNFIGSSDRMEESLVALSMILRVPVADVVVLSSKISGGYDAGRTDAGCVKIEKKFTTPAIEEYFASSSWLDENWDELFYQVIDLSLNKTIDALGRQDFEENLQRYKDYSAQVTENCLDKAVFPCPITMPNQTELAKEDCYFADSGCGYKCIEGVLKSESKKLWADLWAKKSEPVQSEVVVSPSVKEVTKVDQSSIVEGSKVEEVKTESSLPDQSITVQKAEVEKVKTEETKIETSLSDQSITVQAPEIKADKIEKTKVEIQIADQSTTVQKPEVEETKIESSLADQTTTVQKPEIDEAKTEEAKAESPLADHLNTIQKPEVEETKIESSLPDQPNAVQKPEVEEVKIENPLADQSNTIQKSEAGEAKTEETKTEETKVESSFADQTTTVQKLEANEAKTEEAKVESPLADQPNTIQKSEAEETKTEETETEEIKVESPLPDQSITLQKSEVEEVKTEEAKTEEAKTESLLSDQPNAVQKPEIEEAKIESSLPDQPNTIQKPDIKEARTGEIKVETLLSDQPDTINGQNNLTVSVTESPALVVRASSISADNASKTSPMEESKTEGVKTSSTSDTAARVNTTAPSSGISSVVKTTAGLSTNRSKFVRLGNKTKVLAEDFALHSGKRQAFPAWMNEYIDFHSGRIDESGRVKEGTPYLVYQCHGSCAGLGGRLKGMIKSFYAAICSRRVFLIHSDFPFGLKDFLEPKLVHWDASVDPNTIQTLEVFNRNLDSNKVDLPTEVVGIGIQKAHGKEMVDLNQVLESESCAKFTAENKLEEILKDEESLYTFAFHALFKFRKSVVARAATLKKLSGLYSKKAYVGIHVRTGEGDSWSENSVRLRKESEGGVGKYADCFSKFKEKHGFFQAYVASDSTEAKEELAAADNSIMASPANIFHIDRSLSPEVESSENNKSGQVTSMKDARAGMLDVFAELMILRDAKCVIMSNSGMSFAAHFIGGLKRCGVDVSACTDGALETTYSKYTQTRNQLVRLD